MLITGSPGICIGIDAQQKEFQSHPAYRFLEPLIRIPPQMTVLEVSSHNKKGVNGDADWPLYKDANGDDVIFDASGPGCIKSMWDTGFDPNAILQFCFDGDTVPRIRVNILDFYKGKHPLFPAPLVSYEKRGMWGDLPYAGSCSDTVFDIPEDQYKGGIYLLPHHIRKVSLPGRNTVVHRKGRPIGNRGLLSEAGGSTLRGHDA